MKRLTILLALIFCSFQSFAQTESNVSWTTYDEILSRIKAPEFPNKDFVITDFGAVEGGKEDCTNAIKKAVDKCNSEGGGRVVIPEGTFLTGAIHLKSNINLHLKKGATLLFTTDPSAYLPVVFT